MKKFRRDEIFMQSLILDIANRDERIKAVIMNGSRVSPGAKKDGLQDFDIIYVVTDVAPFVENQTWVDQFGERLIMQKPDGMSCAWKTLKDRFAFLMQFKDGNHIDLTLQTTGHYLKSHKDSQSLVLLDKDGIIDKLPTPSDKDYLPQPPTEIGFNDCCNEFFWVSLYVAKGIARRQLIYAKHMSEQICKNELITLLSWHAAIKSNFQQPIGHSAKYLENIIEKDLWGKFKKTFVGTDDKDMWNALINQCELFDTVAKKIAGKYSYNYPDNEYTGVINHLRALKTQWRNEHAYSRN